MQPSAIEVSAPPRRPPHPASGVAFALLSAASFGTAGAFAQSLLAQGWSPGAVVLARLSLAAAVLLAPALIALRGRWGLLRRHVPLIAAYGVIAIAGCQLAYFIAVHRLSVGVALLLEYTSPLLLVLGAWALTRRPPGRLTVVGSVAAVVGLVAVLDVAGHARLDGVGVGFGLLAAVGSAGYFVISARAHDDLPPLVLATGGLIVGALVLAAAGVAGVLPLAATTRPVTLAGATLAWYWPVLGIAVLAAALAYLTGIVGSRRLGPTVASFFGLAEVLFAVAWAWLLVGERPGVGQLIGGLVIVGGVALIKLDDLRRSRPAARE